MSCGVEHAGYEQADSLAALAVSRRYPARGCPLCARRSRAGFSDGGVGRTSYQLLAATWVVVTVA